MSAVSNSTVSMLAVSALLLLIGCGAVIEAVGCRRSVMRSQLLFETCVFAVIGVSLILLGCTILETTLVSVGDLTPQIQSLRQ